MTRLSDGMVVQARLHLNPGTGTFLLLLGDQSSCLIFIHFRYVLFVFVLIFMLLFFGVLDPLRVLTGSDRNVNALVNISHYTPSKAKSHVDLPQN